MLAGISITPLTSFLRYEEKMWQRQTKLPEKYKPNNTWQIVIFRIIAKIHIIIIINIISIIIIIVINIIIIILLSQSWSFLLILSSVFPR